LKAPYLVIIDHDESVRKAMKNLIRSLGYSAEAFGSAKAFLESNTIQTASCLILDVNMPEMSGIKLQQHLSAAGYRTPTIFMSARPNEATRARVMEGGAIGYLAKPLCERSSLNQAINPDHSKADIAHRFAPTPSPGPGR
jgi:FixJ family two-component response regulator